jgi:hypothetical protein
MKTLYIFWKWLTDKDFKTKQENAKRLWATIDAATIGRPSCFYNTNGEQIRGWHKPPYKFPSLAEQETNPLILKYR